MNAVSSDSRWTDYETEIFLSEENLRMNNRRRMNRCGAHIYTTFGGRKRTVPRVHGALDNYVLESPAYLNNLIRNVL